MTPERINTQYEIGTQTFDFVDENRDEVLGTEPGKRKIAVRIYYPVSKESVAGKKKVLYVSENKADCLRKMYHVPKSATPISEVDIYEDVEMQSFLCH